MEIYGTHTVHNNVFRKVITFFKNYL